MYHAYGESDFELLNHLHTGTTTLLVGHAYVIKATYSKGVVKVAACEVTTANVGTAANPEIVTHRCNMVTEGSNSSGQVTDTPANSTTEIIVGAAARPASPNNDVVTEGFSGALEEIYLSKVSLEDAQAMVWSDPATGCVNFYIWDYTNPLTRRFWANRTASLLNDGSASVSQWDGAEFQPSTAGWDVVHSNQTFNSELFTMVDGWHPLWGGVLHALFCCYS